MNERSSKRPLEEQIERYVDARLSQEEIDELWAELIQDGEKLEYLKSVANLKAVVRRKRQKRKRAKIRRYGAYAAAAVFALLLGVVLVMNYAPFTGGTAVEPVESIELDYYRSAEGDLTRTGDSTVITRAITLANTGQFEQAVTLLEQQLEGENPPAWESEVNLTLGSLYYNESRYSEAVPHYEAVIQNSGQVDVLTLEKAYWYLGNTYFQMNELEQARTNIEKAYDLNGAYRRVAGSYLEALAE